MKNFFLILFILFFLNCVNSGSTGSGTFISTDDLLLEGEENKVTVLFNWASWCHHCRNQMPEAVRFYRSNIQDNSDIVFQTISIDKDKEAIMNYKKSTEMPEWDIFINGDGGLDASKKLGIIGVPTYAVIDRRINSPSEKIQLFDLVEYKRYIRSL